MKLPWVNKADVPTLEAKTTFRAVLHIVMRDGSAPSWIATGDTPEECEGEFADFLKWYENPEQPPFFFQCRDGEGTNRTGFDRSNVVGYQIKTTPLTKKSA